MPYRTLARRVGDAVRLAEVTRVLWRYGFSDLMARIGIYDSIPAKLLRKLRVITPVGSEPETRGARLRGALVELGPTFVKFGQILSTRPDLIGKPLSDELTDLQDRVTSVPFDTMRAVLVDTLGADETGLFAEFNPEPVASASLSQVYRARLENGTDVAVKLQRPGIRRVIESDLSLIRSIAEWTADHVKDLDWMDPVGTIDEFERSILRELDFTIEARIIDRFRENYRGVEGVFIPQTYPELSGRTVLTIDWVDGVRLDAADKFPARNSNPKVVAARGCDSVCRQIFDYGLFHADPHPGNICVTRNNVIAFLDYGMVGNLERTDVLAMADMLRAILEQDARACVQTLLSFTTAGEVENPEAFEHQISEYLAFEAQAIVAGGEVGKAIEQLTNVLRRHQLQFAPRFSLLMKSLATIESTGHALDPNLDIVPILKPYVERIILERYAPMNLLKEGRRHLFSVARLWAEIPTDVRILLRMLRRGRLKITMNHEGLEHLTNVTDRASNRITFGLIAGSLIVGSSLLMFQGAGSWIIGASGFIGAGVLGLALLISILRSKNF